MNKNQIKIYTSFSGLIHLIKSGELWIDDPTTFYFFSCSKESVDLTLEKLEKLNKSQKEKIKKTVFEAEASNRVIWSKRTNNSAKTERLIDLINATGYISIDKVKLFENSGSREDMWVLLEFLKEFQNVLIIES